jgi:hypothetical protein
MRFVSALVGACLGLLSASTHAHIWVSDDQLTYTEAPSGRVLNGQSASKLLWDGSRFIGTGERTMRLPLVSSPNGADWTLRFDPSSIPPSFAVSGLTGLAYSASLNRYVTTQFTTANGPQFLYSSDLVNWTAASIPSNWANINRSVGSIASNGSGFVAVSDQEGMGTLSSPDGINWTHTLPPGGIGTGVGPIKIHFFNGKYYGVFGAFNNSLQELDEATMQWTQYPTVNLTTGIYVVDVAYANGTFAIATNRATILTSTDKTTWTQHSVPVMSSGFNAIRANGNGFIAVGSAASGTTSYAVTGVFNGSTWVWTPTVITSAGNYRMTDVIVAGGKTVISGWVPGLSYTVSPRVAASGGGSLPVSTIAAVEGTPVSFAALPNSGNSVLSVSGCGATFVGNTITTAPVTASCTVTVTFGVTPASCTLDIDNDGAVLPTTDALVILRRMLTLSSEGLRANAYNPLGLRTDASQMAALIDPMISTKTLDIDGNGSVTAATDGLLLLRALLGFGGNAVTNNALGAGVKTRGDWSSIRQYLITTCGVLNGLAP